MIRTCADYSPHESWCDTQNKISTRCNCIASEYIGKIEDFIALIEEMRKALELANMALGEAKALVSAHEWAIRNDSGNTNIECFERRYINFKEALAKHKEVMGEE
jgi:hypothetical protein